MAQIEAQISLNHLNDMVPSDELIAAQTSADRFARGEDIATAAHNAREAVLAFKEDHSDLWAGEHGLGQMDWLSMPESALDFDQMNAFVDVI